LKQFTIHTNDYLRQDIKGFYHTDYTGYKKPGNPDYINTLKNTFKREQQYNLNQASQQLKNVLLIDLRDILNIITVNSLNVCVIPRAKAEKTYLPNQLLFKRTVWEIINQLDGLIDGTNYIIRHTDTKTTHLSHSPKAAKYAGNGDMPYVGITNNTCDISNNVREKNILLIEDIYTAGVNIDEDAIQALLDKGASIVYFYAIGKTINKRQNFQTFNLDEDIPF